MQGNCNEQPCKAAYQGVPDLEHGAHHVALDGDRDGARCALPLELPQRLCDVGGRCSGAPGVLQHLRELDAVLHSKAIRSASCTLYYRCYTTLLVPAVQTKACYCMQPVLDIHQLQILLTIRTGSGGGPPTGQNSISNSRVWTTCSQHASDEQSPLGQCSRPGPGWGSLGAGHLRPL